ncbi:MAG: SpoIIE family protein phosphatase [Bacteroidota bacterium]
MMDDSSKDSLGAISENDSIRTKPELIDTVNSGNSRIKTSFEKKDQGLAISTKKGDYPRRNYFELETLFFKLLIVVFVIGFLFALPFKIYFRRKRKNKIIPGFVEKFCKKTLIYSPLINAGIVSIAFIVTGLYMVDNLFISGVFTNELKKEIYLQYWIVFMVAGLLTITFVYYWQKHRVQIRYIELVYSKVELRKRVYKYNEGKIRFRLIISSILTTLLPLSIVVSYILLSITSLKELNIYAPSQSELELVFGGYYKLFDDSKTLLSLINKYNLYYINVPDTILMFIGIGMGIFVTIIYLLFFVYWSNSTLIRPIGELLRNMQKTTGGKLNNYSIVRTNDEIGELAENYNIMTTKLNDYISDIAKMNAELEDKVKERTAEIEAQKEEIEAQRDEVESQRDEIEHQRDYVIEQRDLISTQNKAITDSIEYAGTIQNALLPPENVLNQYLGEHFVLFKPRDIVSGDFYWVHQRESDKDKKHVFIAAADCTGHGVPGAFLSMLGIAFLDEIVSVKEENNPARILDKLKSNVIKSLHQTGEIGKSRDGIDIALCYIDYESLRLKYAGAYNSIYIIRKNNNSDAHDVEAYSNSEYYKVEQNKDFELVEIKADKIPIGVSPKKSTSFKLKEFQLKKGDMIYLFSDGYVDQFGGKNRLKFLYRRFKDTLISVNGLPVQQQLIKIERVHNDWKGKENQIDDILVIGIKI